LKDDRFLYAFSRYHLLSGHDGRNAKGWIPDHHTMQPRVISIHAPKIPCWKLTEQMQHLCKQLKCGAKGASS